MSAALAAEKSCGALVVETDQMVRHTSGERKRR